MQLHKLSKLILIGILSLPNLAFAYEPTKFFIGGLVASPIKNLNASSDYAGAPGYFCSDCPTGKIGGVNTSPATTWALKAGYTYSENLSFDISYYSFSHGESSWGTDFSSFNGTYNPAAATAFTSKEISSDATFISAYYNLNLDNGVRPYAGLGVGLSRNKFDYTDEGSYSFINSHTTTDVAWKLDIGSQYELKNHLILDLSLTLVDLGEYKSANSRGSSSEVIIPYKFSTGLSPIVSLGLIYKF